MRRMSLPTSEFIWRQFLKYYEDCFDLVSAPSDFCRREFAFLLLKQKTMVRHRSYRNIHDLQSFLIVNVPSDIYYSTACYDRPDNAEMGNKGWLGADLVFDIDADHLPTSCNKIHDQWVCSNCQFSGKGLTPIQCPVCGCRTFKSKTWPCEECLNSAKKETIKLLEMLSHDFGFSDEMLRTFYSGHRGYHVHIENEVVRTLDAAARREIVDYISALGFYHSYALSEGGRQRGLQRLPSMKGVGWRGRIAKSLFNCLSDNSSNMAGVKLKKNTVERIIQNRQRILESLAEGRAPLIRGVGAESWKAMIDYCVSLSAARVDTVVTTDVHRLIRLPGTLHGKTGLRKVELSPSSVQSFEPFKSSVAFKNGSATVCVSDAPEFTLDDRTFGPYKNTRVDLPMAAAVLLICKGRAEVVG